MAKMTQEKLNEKWQQKENERLLKMLEKRLEKEKRYYCSEKDKEAEEAYKRLQELAKERTDNG